MATTRRLARGARAGSPWLPWTVGSLSCPPGEGRRQARGWAWLEIGRDSIACLVVVAAVVVAVVVVVVVVVVSARPGSRRRPVSGGTRIERSGFDLAAFMRRRTIRGVHRSQAGSGMHAPGGQWSRPAVGIAIATDRRLVAQRACGPNGATSGGGPLGQLLESRPPPDTGAPSEGLALFRWPSAWASAAPVIGRHATGPTPDLGPARLLGPAQKSLIFGRCSLCGPAGRTKEQIESC